MRARLGRVGPNLATLGNALLGVGAIAYTLLGNKLFASLLVVAGVSLDGLDGILARRSGLPESSFGRVADSAADAITFGVAPALLVGVHSFNAPQWAPYSAYTLSIGILVAALALARLAIYTLRAYHHPYFVGVPTPLMALSIVVLVLWFDEPPLLATLPIVFTSLAALAAVAMVLPIRFPKIRRDSAIRTPMIVTAVALVAAIVSLQFAPDVRSTLGWLALGSSLIAGAGILVYCLYGPQSVARDQRRAEAVAHG